MTAFPHNRKATGDSARTSWFAWTLLLATLLLLGYTPLLFAADYDVSVTGRVVCHLGSDTKPVAFARVELMDSDDRNIPWGDDELAAGATDADGRFNLSGKAGDWDPFDQGYGKPDIYVRVYLTDDNNRPLGPGDNPPINPVRLTNEIDYAWGAQSAITDDTSGAMDLGEFSWGEPSGDHGGAACMTWLVGRDRFLEYFRLRHKLPAPGRLDIEYFSAVYVGTAWSSWDTIHWPTAYKTLGWADVDNSMGHEFGHIVRHSLDGSEAHFVNDLFAYALGQKHSKCSHPPIPSAAFGFNEGWGDFWTPRLLGGCNSANTPGYVIDRNLQGDVNWVLTNLSKCWTRLADDGYGFVGRAGMALVLEQNPGTIHSLGEFERAYQKLYPQCDLNVPAPDTAEATAWVEKQTDANLKAALSTILSTVRRKKADSTREKSAIEREIHGMLADASIVTCPPEPCERLRELARRLQGVQYELDQLRILSRYWPQLIEVQAAPEKGGRAAGEMLLRHERLQAQVKRELQAARMKNWKQAVGYFDRLAARVPDLKGEARAMRERGSRMTKEDDYLSLAVLPLEGLVPAKSVRR